MAIFLILIDEHDRPLSIGSLDGIGRDQRVSGTVADVRGGRKHLVGAIGLQPLLIDQLAREELRQGLLDGVVGMNGKHAERSSRVIAAVFQLQRKIVEVVDAAAAIAKK